MQKATHQGECQVCGRVQRLPDGKLAKHGYTVRRGFFSGVCWGAGHLPLEQDNSLLEQAIAWAQKGLDTLNARVDQLVEDHDPAEVYTTQYVGGRERYRQRFLPAAQIVRGEGSERSIWIVPVETTGFSWRSNAHVGSCVPGETATEAAYKANQHFVQRELVPEVKQIRSYIRWQQGRAANWEPKPLQEIAA